MAPGQVVQWLKEVEKCHVSGDGEYLSVERLLKECDELREQIAAFERLTGILIECLFNSAERSVEGN